MNDYLQLDIDTAFDFTNLSNATEEDGPFQGAFVRHRNMIGAPCDVFIDFDTPTTARDMPNTNRWKVNNWERLSLSPSIVCTAELCNFHIVVYDGIVRDLNWYNLPPGLRKSLDKLQKLWFSTDLNDDTDFKMEMGAAIWSVLEESGRDKAPKEENGDGETDQTAAATNAE